MSCVTCLCICRHGLRCAQSHVLQQSTQHCFLASICIYKNYKDQDINNIVITVKVTFNNTMPLDAASSNKISTSFQFSIEVLLPLLLDQHICVPCLHLNLNKISEMTATFS